jgi:hypothetical protein
VVPRSWQAFAEDAEITRIHNDQIGIMLKSWKLCLLTRKPDADLSGRSLLSESVILCLELKQSNGASPVRIIAFYRQTLDQLREHRTSLKLTGATFRKNGRDIIDEIFADMDKAIFNVEQLMSRLEQGA